MNAKQTVSAILATATVSGAFLLAPVGRPRAGGVRINLWISYRQHRRRRSQRDDNHQRPGEGYIDDNHFKWKRRLYG